jgi:DNA (cytosine-5)-methyltransferase 1
LRVAAIRGDMEEILPARSSRSSSPTVVDLFAGAGLLSYAFAREGFRVTRAIELNRWAAATYAANLGDHLERLDVAAAVPRGRCDVLVAGPPCQGFSTLGTRRTNDPRNFLSRHVVRFAQEMRPAIVVIENVVTFLDSNVWHSVRRALKRLDYYVHAFVLDAADFGVPQTRVRSFTIATRTEDFLIPPSRARRRTVREAFDGLSLKPDGRNFHYAPSPSPIALARMRVIPPGGDKRDVMKRAPHLVPKSWLSLARVKTQATDVWGRMEWDAPSNTLRTALQNPSKGRYIHPSQDRVISLREAARLQTVPNSWSFEGQPYPVARQIGNSVPPLLGRAVARSVMRALG